MTGAGNNLCVTCSGSTTCTDCGTNAILDGFGGCTSCTTSQYNSGGTCTDCHITCATCTSSTNCVSCAQGYKFGNNGLSSTNCIAICGDYIVG